MSDELRAAVTRMRSVDISYMPVYPGGQKSFDRDCQQLASAYLSEHPADDDKPAMPEWLESLGYTDSMGMRYEKRYELCNGIRIMFFAREHPQRWAADIWIGSGKCHVKKNPTRGDVRRLLTALGTEGAK